MTYSDLRCASYIRYSSHKQSDGLSIETQKLKNENAIHKFDAVFVDHYIDEAVSGFHKKIGIRNEMRRLIHDITLGKVNCVVFIDESRLTRQIIDFYHDFYFPIHAVNPDILFIKSSDNSIWDPHHPYSKLNLIDAYKESEKKHAYAINSQTLQLQNKIRPGSRLPLGIKSIHNSVITPNQDIAIVIFMFELASWGYSERKIADILTSLGIGVQNNYGTDSTLNESFQKKWCHTSVRSILNNPIYIGKCTWNRRKSRNSSSPKPSEEITIYDEANPVIPVQLWNLVHGDISSSESNVDFSKRMDTPYLVSSIVECSTCSSKLITKNSLKSIDIKRRFTKKGIPLDYYYCPNCQYKIDHDFLDNHIITLLGKQLNSHFTPFQVKKKIDSLIKETNKEITLINESLTRLHQSKMSEPWINFNLSAKEELKYIELLNKEYDETENTLQKKLQLLQNLSNLDTTETFNRLLIRITNSNIKLLNKIEQRYVLLSSINKLKLKLLKNGELIIDEVCFNNIPLPFAK